MKQALEAYVILNMHMTICYFCPDGLIAVTLNLSTAGFPTIMAHLQKQ